MQTIKPKLAKLIPLLGSNQPNEAAAAARAMTRMLASVKCDWHDIVKLVLNEEPAPFNRTQHKAPPKKPDASGWRISARGNPWRKYGNVVVTVFRSTSKYSKGDWAVVIVDGDDKTYLNDFDSMEEAKEAAEAHFSGTVYDEDETVPF